MPPPKYILLKCNTCILWEIHCTISFNPSRGTGWPKLRRRPPEGEPRGGQEHLPGFAEVNVWLLASVVDLDAD